MVIYVDNGLRWFDRRFLEYLRERKNSEAISMIKNAQSISSLDQFKDFKERTLLHISVINENALITQYLIEQGCNVEAKDNDEETPLTTALQLKNLEIIQILLGAEKEIFNIDNYIHLAAFSYPNDLPMLKNLIVTLTSECSDDKERADKLLELRFPLAAVVFVFKSVELTKLMIDGGCSVDDRLASTGETALHTAVEFSDIDNVKLLLDRGVEIDVRDNKNCTPLSRFKMYSNDPDDKLEILKLLLDRGASLTTNFSSCRDCYSMYYWNIDETILSKLLYESDSRVIRVLLSYINLFEKDSKGMTPIHHLAKNENSGVLEVLKNEKFDVNARDLNGWTALDFAVRGTDSEKIIFLLENGANPNNIDNNGDTALVFLLSQLQIPVVKNNIELLLAYDADPQLTISDKNNSIALISAMDEYLDFAKILIAHLARLHSCGVPLCKFIYEKIKSNRVYKDYFDSCKSQIEHMKAITVYESVTWFKILRASRKKLSMYARNEVFALSYEFSKSMYQCVDLHYDKFLTLRVNKAIEIAKIKNDAALAVCKIVGLPVEIVINIADDIVDYLSETDIENLAKV